MAKHIHIYVGTRDKAKQVSAKDSECHTEDESITEAMRLSDDAKKATAKATSQGSYSNHDNAGKAHTTAANAWRTINGAAAEKNAAEHQRQAQFHFSNRDR